MGIKADCRYDDAGPHTVKLTVRNQATTTNYDSAALSVAAAYKYLDALWETDPATAAAWTQANAEARQYGIKLET
jgi:transcriptional regulator of nitric oxide reductase